jgi:hypothetical protein
MLNVLIIISLIFITLAINPSKIFQKIKQADNNGQLNTITAESQTTLIKLSDCTINLNGDPVLYGQSKYYSYYNHSIQLTCNHLKKDKGTGNTKQTKSLRIGLIYESIYVSIAFPPVIVLNLQKLEYLKWIIYDINKEGFEKEITESFANYFKRVVGEVTMPESYNNFHSVYYFMDKICNNEIAVSKDLKINKLLFKDYKDITVVDIHDDDMLIISPFNVYFEIDLTDGNNLTSVLQFAEVRFSRKYDEFSESRAILGGNIYGDSLVKIIGDLFIKKFKAAKSNLSDSLVNNLAFLE